MDEVSFFKGRARDNSLNILRKFDFLVYGGIERLKSDSKNYEVCL